MIELKRLKNITPKARRQHMKSRDLTEIVCIIDRSGSMAAIESDAIGGFNHFVEDQKRLPGAARLTLVLFDHSYEKVYDGLPLSRVPQLNAATYSPRGTTALLDAIGRTLDDLTHRLASVPEGAYPDRVVIAVLTDGLENASRDYTRDRVFEKIRHLQKNYEWQFIFLAANQDAIQSGAQLGIAADTSLAFSSTPLGTQKAFCTMSFMTGNARKKKKQTKKRIGF
jgi:hypothetical protein